MSASSKDNTGRRWRAEVRVYQTQVDHSGRATWLAEVLHPAGWTIAEIACAVATKEAALTELHRLLFHRQQLTNAAIRAVGRYTVEQMSMALIARIRAMFGKKTVAS